MDNEKDKTGKPHPTAAVYAEIRTSQAPFDKLPVFDLARLTGDRFGAVALREEITRQDTASITSEQGLLVPDNATHNEGNGSEGGSEARRRLGKNRAAQTRKKTREAVGKICSGR